MQRHLVATLVTLLFSNFCNSYSFRNRHTICCILQWKNYKIWKCCSKANSISNALTKQLSMLYFFCYIVFIYIVCLCVYLLPFYQWYPKFKHNLKINNYCHFFYSASSSSFFFKSFRFKNFKTKERD